MQRFCIVCEDSAKFRAKHMQSFYARRKTLQNLCAKTLLTLCSAKVLHSLRGFVQSLCKVFMHVARLCKTFARNFANPLRETLQNLCAKLCKPFARNVEMSLDQNFANPLHCKGIAKFSRKGFAKGFLLFWQRVCKGFAKGIQREFLCKPFARLVRASPEHIPLSQQKEDYRHHRQQEFV